MLCTAAKLASDPNNPTQEPGSPFFSLGFFGEAKKSKSPAAATERHRNVSTRQLQFTSKLSGRATRKRKRAFSGSEPKFPEPAARPSGASLCCAAKLRSDPKNHSSVLQAHCDNSLGRCQAAQTSRPSRVTPPSRPAATLDESEQNLNTPAAALDHTLPAPAGCGLRAGANLLVRTLGTCPTSETATSPKCRR